MLRSGRSPAGALLVALPLTALPSLPQRGAHDASAPPDRAHAVADLIHRSGVVPRCWNAYLRARPAAASVRLRLRVDVRADGAIAGVVALTPAPPPLVRCVTEGLRRLAAAPGAPGRVEAFYSFSSGAPAPVPSRP